MPCVPEMRPTPRLPVASRSRPSVASLVEVREVTPTRIVKRQMRHPDCVWVRTSAPLPDDPLVHACRLAYASDLGSGFGQVAVPGLATGGPSIDHAVGVTRLLRADQWMLLDLAPRKAASSRRGLRRLVAGRRWSPGCVIAQEMLLRELVLDDEMLPRVADFLGVTPEE